jgi:hypothetical protein
MMHSLRKIWVALLTLLVAAIMVSAPAAAQQQKPNILVIWGDDIGWSNILGLTWHLNMPTCAQA